MDAYLKLQNIKKKPLSLSSSTISRGSFGSLLQSITESEDRSQQDQTNSKLSTPKDKVKPKPNKEIIKPNDLISKDSIERLTKEKDKDNVIKQTKMPSEERTPLLRKPFSTEGSSNLSRNSASINLLKTAFPEREKGQIFRKGWQTDGLNSKKSSASSQSSYGFESDDVISEIEEMQQKEDKSLTSLKKQEKQKNVNNLSFEANQMLLNSNLNLNNQSKTNMPIQSKISVPNNLLKKKIEYQPLLQKGNKVDQKMFKKPNLIDPMNQKSQNKKIGSNAINIKKSRVGLESTRSDVGLYSKSSTKSVNSMSKSGWTMTGRKNEIIRQCTIAVFQYCSHEIGIACFNHTTGQFYLCQLVENLTYFKTVSTIQTFSPLEIIYSQTFENTLLIKRLRQKFKQVSFKGVIRRNFDEEGGYNIYMKSSFHQNINHTTRFLAFSCLNALINHLENNLENRFKPDALNIKWHRLDQLLIIEPDAISDLEIFYNYTTKKRQKCFIENFSCVTFGGMRMLRANFLQPPSEQKIILDRQKLVQKMLENPSLFDFFEKEFHTYKYYEPITAKFIQLPKGQNFKSLRTYMSSIFMLSNQCLSLKRLYQALQNRNAFDLPIVERLDQKLQSHKLKLLRSVIEQNFEQNIIKNFEDMKNKKQKYLFLFKVERIEDEFAAVTRTTYTQTVETIKKYFQEIKRKTREDMHLMYNDNKGYFIKVTQNTDLHNLTQKIEQNLVQISAKGRIVTFSTQILSSLNNRLKQNQQTLILQSQSLLRKVIQEIQKNIDILFQINQILSTIDMTMAFVRYIHRYSMFVRFTKPKFIKGSNAFKIEKLLPVWMLSPQNYDKQELQRIDFNKTDEEKNIMILQKSSNSVSQNIIMTSMAYTVILSQMGCFVPAQNVEFTVFQSILSKIQFDQTTQRGLSRFQMNIVKLKNILHNCFDKNEGRTLILMDQIVRGTQHEQQCALSLAIIEQLQKNYGMMIALTSDRMLVKYLTNHKQFQRVMMIRTKNSQIEFNAIEEIAKQSAEIMGELNFDEKFIQKFQEIKIKPNYTENDKHQVEFGRIDKQEIQL